MNEQPGIGPNPPHNCLFYWQIRVYHEDTDSAGIVYYANYLKFMERARTEWLRRMGYEQDQLKTRAGIQFVVSRATMQFLLPARFNDLLYADILSIDCGRVALTLAQRVLLDESRVCCRGEIQIASVDAVTLRPKPLPTDIRHQLQRGSQSFSS